MSHLRPVSDQQKRFSRGYDEVILSMNNIHKKGLANFMLTSERRNSMNSQISRLADYYIRLGLPDDAGLSEIRKPPFMSVFRKASLIPVPFCMATFMCSAFWNLGQMTSGGFLGQITAVVAYPLILVVLLQR